MKYSKCSKQDLEEALELINKFKYKENVRFKTLENKSFTLGVKDSGGAGHRIHISGLGVLTKNKSPHACWHVHGDFFDALFLVNPNAKIFSSRGGWITKFSGNWQDFNIGSMFHPVQFSDSCECKKTGMESKCIIDPVIKIRSDSNLFLFKEHQLIKFLNEERGSKHGSKKIR